MTFKTDTDIEHLTNRFIARTLPKSEWTHAAHFAVALCLLRRSRFNARKDMPDLIRRYNEATGVENTDTEGYHETITLASIRAANAALSDADNTTSLLDVLNTLMKSRCGRSDWLLEHWRRERLFSVEARRVWVEPDLKPLSF